MLPKVSGERHDVQPIVPRREVREHAIRTIGRTVVHEDRLEETQWHGFVFEALPDLVDFGGEFDERIRAAIDRRDGAEQDIVHVALSGRTLW